MLSNVKRYWRGGGPFVWMSGGAAAIVLLMIGGLLYVITAKGLGMFWPHALSQVALADGTRLLGEQWNRERVPATQSPGEAVPYRIRMKIGNRDIYSLDFRWVQEDEITERAQPDQAATLERREWGNFYGFLRAVKVGGERVVGGDQAGWSALQRYMGRMDSLHHRIRRIEKKEIGDINYRIERARLRIRGLAMREDTTEAQVRIGLAKHRKAIRAAEREYDNIQSELARMRKQAADYVATFATVDGYERDFQIMGLVRAYRPNRMPLYAKATFYASRAWEFVSGEPRESNTEGGVFPAIFGTVLMVFLMSLAVVPFGVMAAVYLHEYAKQGTMVQLVRIAVNNLAGVPSIVYGVFGLGFFVYIVGGAIDRFFFAEALPSPTFGTGGILWASLTLALLTVPVVIVATEEGLAAVPREIREGSLALSATKFETLLRVVLPSATPGILTGVILSMARAAGEVAPLMITGVVKLAPDLPLDGRFPFLHLDRKFMHLGFQIYDVGFQSPNVEAALPMLYATTLLLVLVVVLASMVAIIVRNRLRRRFAFGTF